MQRRSVLGGTVVWSVATALRVDAQLPQMRLAFVEAGTAAANRAFLDSFVRGLRSQGYKVGAQIVIEAYWAGGAVERFPKLLAEAIARDPRVIIVGSTPGALAAKAATTRIPIVFVGVSDPFQRGLVETLAHPGGNVTGLSAGEVGTIAKVVGYLARMLPSASRIGVLWNPSGIERRMQQAREAISRLGLTSSMFEVRRAEEISGAFAAMHEQAIDGFVAVTDPLTLSNRELVVRLAAQFRLPGGYEFPEFARAGGLIAYSSNIPLLFERAAVYVDKILRGSAPGDLPVEAPTAYQLVVNLRTARELGIAVPSELLLSADEVIR